MEKLFDSELKVMEPLWEDGPQTAGALAKKLADACGWNRNTTYTVIKKLVDKGVIARSDPGGGRPASGAHRRHFFSRETLTKKSFGPPPPPAVPSNCRTTAGRDFNSETVMRCAI